MTDKVKYYSLMLIKVIICVNIYYIRREGDEIYAG